MHVARARPPPNQGAARTGIVDEYDEVLASELGLEFQKGLEHRHRLGCKNLLSPGQPSRHDPTDDVKPPALGLASRLDVRGLEEHPAQAAKAVLGSPVRGPRGVRLQNERSRAGAYDGHAPRLDVRRLMHEKGEALPKLRRQTGAAVEVCRCFKGPHTVLPKRSKELDPVQPTLPLHFEAWPDEHESSSKRAAAKER